MSELEYTAVFEEALPCPGNHKTKRRFKALMAVIDYSTNFPGPFFSGNFVVGLHRLVLRVGVVLAYTKFGEDIGRSPATSALPIYTFRFQICYFVLKPESCDVDCCRKSRHLFVPVKSG